MELAVTDGYTTGEVAEQMRESKDVVQFVQYRVGSGEEDQGTAPFGFLEVSGPVTKSGVWISGAHVGASDSGYDSCVKGQSDDKDQLHRFHFCSRVN